MARRAADATPPRDLGRRLGPDQGPPPGPAREGRQGQPPIRRRRPRDRQDRCPLAWPARAVRQLEQRLFEALHDPDLEWLILDSTVIRAHRAPPAPKKSGW